MGIFLTKINDKSYSYTPCLRYVIRDGEKVLQQMLWEHDPYGDYMNEREHIWIDVKTTEEDDAKP